MLLAAETQTSRSWAGLIALAAAYVIFRLITPLLRKILNPSPTPALPGVKRTKVQATVGVTEDEPEPEPVGWWGRIVEVGGVRMRQVRQVVKTGSHELPAVEADDEADEELDVPLDEEEGSAEQIEKMEDYISRARGLKVPYNHIVRVVVEHYGVSESTAKRRIREVDEARRPAA